MTTRQSDPEDSQRDPQAVNAEASDTDKTPEQQMADFEESLKNEDWGHQPC